MIFYAAAAAERAMRVQEVIVRALSGALTWLQAADILGMTPRSVRRWRARYEAGGPIALYDRRGRRPSWRKAPALEVQRLLRLYREQYPGFNVRHFHHLARRDHGVTADYVQEMRKRGKDKLAPDDIIRLRDRGDSPYELKLGQWNYHVDRLVAEIERTLEKIIMKSQKAVDKSEKAIDKTQKAVDKLTR